ncbi:MAG: hypothetical protein HUJ26_02250 [Planctomycetaceae bacterium]|nr:hypothetical protein [Planctomycetaceae bacterium]
MNPNSLLWLAAGLITGLAHAGLIYRETRPPFVFLGAALFRLLLVGAVFVGGALSGHLLETTLGWLAAYPVTVLVIATRKIT